MILRIQLLSERNWQTNLKKDMGSKAGLMPQTALVEIEWQRLGSGTHQNHDQTLWRTLSCQRNCFRGGPSSLPPGQPARVLQRVCDCARDKRGEISKLRRVGRRKRPKLRKQLRQRRKRTQTVRALDSLLVTHRLSQVRMNSPSGSLTRGLRAICVRTASCLPLFTS